METGRLVEAACVAWFACLSESNVELPDQHGVQLVPIEIVENCSFKFLLGICDVGGVAHVGVRPQLPPFFGAIHYRLPLHVGLKVVVSGIKHDKFIVLGRKRTLFKSNARIHKSKFFFGETMIIKLTFQNLATHLESSRRVLVVVRVLASPFILDAIIEAGNHYHLQTES